MSNLPPALLELLGDPDGKRAEACILSVIADLERAGIKQCAIARALARVLLGFCAENGKQSDKFGWANETLFNTGEALRTRALLARRAWVRRFMKRTGRLYVDASVCIELELPEVREALDARLTALDAQGRA